MNKKMFVMVLVFGLFVVTGLLMVLSYNSMVSKSQTVDQDTSEIKNKYTAKVQILGELLPQVRQYQQFEATTLTNITALRSQWMKAINDSAPSSSLINISSRLDANTTKIYNTFVATAEAYPTLFSGTLVAQYMGEVVDTNQQLSYARTQYNGAVRDYNSYIKSFPNNLFAGSFGYAERQYWGTEFPGDALNT
jgi:LemA protein